MLCVNGKARAAAIRRSSRCATRADPLASALSGGRPSDRAGAPPLSSPFFQGKTFVLSLALRSDVFVKTNSRLHAVVLSPNKCQLCRRMSRSCTACSSILCNLSSPHLAVTLCKWSVTGEPVMPAQFLTLSDDTVLDFLNTSASDDTRSRETFASDRHVVEWMQANRLVSTTKLRGGHTGQRRACA